MQQVIPIVGDSSLMTSGDCNAVVPRAWPTRGGVLHPDGTLPLEDADGLQDQLDARWRALHALQQTN